MTRTLTIAFLLCSIGVIAQEKPTAKTDTTALFRLWQAEMAKEVPVWVLAYKNNKLIVIKGFATGDGRLLGLNKAPLPASIVLFATVKREEDKPKKK